MEATATVGDGGGGVLARGVRAPECAGSDESHIPGSGM